MGHVDLTAGWESEEAMGASSQAATNPTATTHTEGLKLSFQCWIPSRKTGNTNLCSLSFDQAGNQTKVNSFSNTLYVYQFGHKIGSTIIAPSSFVCNFTAQMLPQIIYFLDNLLETENCKISPFLNCVSLFTLSLILQ